MKIEQPILYIFSGLPGTGKTVLSRMLAQYLPAVFLRIDTVEQGLRDLCALDVQGEGYRLSYRVAADNLKLGTSVVADSCNPIALTRNEWEQVAVEASAGFINIEIICSDQTVHQDRVETRSATVPNLVLPTWQEVGSREYDPWTADRVVVDTAFQTPDQSFKGLVSKIESLRYTL